MKKKLLLPLCVGVLLAGCGGQTETTIEKEEITYWDNLTEVSSWQDIDMKINATADLHKTTDVDGETSELNIKDLSLLMDGDIQIDKETMTGKIDLNLGFPEEFRISLAQNPSLSHIELPEAINLNMYITPNSVLIPKDLYSVAATVLLGIPVDAEIIPFDYVSIDSDETGIQLSTLAGVTVSEEDKEKYNALQEDLGVDIISSNEGKTFKVTLDKAKITDLIVKFGQTFETQEEFENFLNTLEVTYAPEEAPKMYEVLKDETTIRTTFEETINDMMIDYTVNFEPEQYMTDVILELSDAEAQMKVNLNSTTKKTELSEMAPEEGSVIMSMDEAATAFMGAWISQSGL
ncbi:hypothetical protein AN639_04445 [Candidatus Epulonipiscium fishelsonii]|uniref:Uncharacterized protein n=1 Tax=Candidatus Epulonipiscium fishelsonii TaxID=77094 RepID=A0ACC8X8E1_9FIRM|nr:hypothetical protein AN396_11135 [Epulopiscium sp. SCG-B11WGA-EpuloA1]ONI40543.1 hypothetical protein AN639_04445 [Epulopiscium sp. SCG-B05WGA-EpuloA1]ONI47186.1 hypothetical protein AN644_01260 [Epulopiscium sp. SCG-C06WGA-EpuloA1]